MAVAGVALWSSLMPGGQPQPVATVSDKVLHGSGYALLAFLLLMAWRPPVRVIASFLTVTAYGAVIEILQGLTPTRTPDLLDAATNALGAAIGITAAYALIALTARSAAGSST